MTTHAPKVYGKVFATLLLLLALTWGIGYVNLGPFNLIVALTIAIAKGPPRRYVFHAYQGKQSLAAFSRERGSAVAAYSPGADVR